jgi:phosphoserine phosphatase RsbX
MSAGGGLGAQDCLEWACAGRALPGETRSGDLAVRVAAGDDDVVALIDGLGHGEEAADASQRAREVVEAHAASEPLDTVVNATHQALVRTRGVTMTIASIGCSGAMHWLGVGNVEAHVVRREGNRPRRVASPVLLGGVVGYRLPRLRVSSVDLEPDDLIVMATDGIDPGFVDHVMVSAPVDRVVDAIVDRCARPNDDALVLAARYRGPRA